jgi:PRC-barrel domain
MTEHEQDAEWNVAEWHGKTIADRDGEKIGKLQDVYVDVETDEPQFATVKEGFIGRHLTLVPLGGIKVAQMCCKSESPRSRSSGGPTSSSTARSSPRPTSRRSITTASSTTRRPTLKADADWLAAEHLARESGLSGRL